MSKEELLKYLIAEIDLIMHDKDYRFENANGTWYSRESCRDLTNEEVFEELRTELRQLYDENAQLKQQLHDLPKRIVEDIKKVSDTAILGSGEVYDYTITAKNLDTILKKYGGEDE